jgi:succinyl-diaminopimelate desuccinylase
MSEILQLTRELVAIASISNDRIQCHRALDWALKQIGEGLYGHQREHEGFRCAVLSTREGKRSRLILNCHLDVVHAPPAQFQTRIEGDQLWGRGTYDMKGGAAVYVLLARELAALPEAERPDVQFQFVTDEEIGGHRGSERLVADGYLAELFIAGEPTELGICNEAKGVYWVSLRLRGEPGHAARPWETRNPIWALNEGLKRLEERYPVPTESVWATTATPTGLSAGNSHNRVPDTLELKLDIRHLPAESPDDIALVLRECFPGCELEVIQRSYSLYTAPDHPELQRIVRLQTEHTGTAPRFYQEHFASDARYWSHAGVPAICWGPCGGGMHADHEHLDLPSLELYAALVRKLLTSYS